MENSLRTASLKTEALDLRNRLLDFRLKSLFSVGSDSARVIPGIDPRLNQTALSLLSLVDDSGLRDEIADMLREQHSTLSATRAESSEARIVGALQRALASGNRSSVSLREIAQLANAGEDELDATLSPREAGRTLRALNIPLHKSHGDIVVPQSARPAVEALANRLGVV